MKYMIYGQMVHDAQAQKTITVFVHANRQYPQISEIFKETELFHPLK